MNLKKVQLSIFSGVTERNGDNIVFSVILWLYSLYCAFMLTCFPLKYPLLQLEFTYLAALFLPLKLIIFTANLLLSFYLLNLNPSFYGYLTPYFSYLKSHLLYCLRFVHCKSVILQKIIVYNEMLRSVYQPWFLYHNHRTLYMGSSVKRQQPHFTFFINASIFVMAYLAKCSYTITTKFGKVMPSA